MKKVLKVLLVLVILVVNGLAQWEFLGMFQAGGDHPRRIKSILLGTLLLLSFCTAHPSRLCPPGFLFCNPSTVLFVLFKLPLPVRVALVILPLIPSLGYMFCVVRMLRRVDELQRRIQLEAIGFAFAATVILAMTVDLLEQAKLLPAIHWGWSGLVVAMALLWGVGNVMASRRYR